MKSNFPKVLHRVGNMTMIEQVILKTNILKPDSVIVVVGYKANQVKEVLKNQNVEFVFTKGSIRNWACYYEMQTKNYIQNMDTQ